MQFAFRSGAPFFAKPIIARLNQIARVIIPYATSVHVFRGVNCTAGHEHPRLLRLPTERRLELLKDGSSALAELLGRTRMRPASKSPSLSLLGRLPSMRVVCYRPWITLSFRQRSARRSVRCRGRIRSVSSLAAPLARLRWLRVSSREPCLAAVRVAAHRSYRRGVR